MQEQLRIVRNIAILLENGLFPGRESAGLNECRAFVSNFARELERAQLRAEADVPAEPAPEAPTPLKRRKGRA